MAKAVQKVLNDNNTAISAIPAFQNAKTDLDAAVDKIDEIVLSQIANTKGKAKDKKAAATAAIDSAVALIGPAKSYATEAENNSLFQSFNYSLSSLKKLRDTELLSTLTLIGRNLSANVANLADYGITEAEVSGFGKLIEDYKELLSAPRNAITNKSAATASVKEKFAALKPVLLRLDGLAAAQKKANPVFYNAFKAARAVVDNKGRTRQKPAA